MAETVAGVGSLRRNEMRPLGEAITANNPLQETAAAILVPRKFEALSGRRC